MNHSIFIECFGDMKDERVERTKKHLLLDIIALVLFAIMAGATTFDEIELFGEVHIDWLKQYLQLPNGIPSHDTIRRVLGFLDHKMLIDNFMTWIGKIKNLFKETVVPIDGKTMRGSHRKSKGLKALHVLSAYSCANGLSLGQLKVDGKTNEITQIPELLKQIAIAGAIVTIDAMGCQKDVAAAIVEQEADYILTVKDNQGNMHEAIEDVFQLSENKQFNKDMDINTFEEEIECEHGRLVTREIKTLPADMIAHAVPLQEWAQLHTIVQVTSTDHKTETLTIEKRYYITSLDNKESQRISNGIRAHWSIENKLHWSLDVTFKEDDSRIRDDNTALNFAWFRKMALSFLKPITIGKKKRSIKQKMIMNHARPANIEKYMEQVI